MKSHSLLFSILLLCSVLSLPGASDESVPPGRYWLEPSISMPVSGPGEIRDVTFVFTNPLTAPISVRSATADCWCINLRRPQEPIPPGATGTVSVSARARIAEGAFVNRIYVLFDNGEYSKLEVWG
ncbi:MAG TPA: DUF1573 domain-containing protein, partial [bacterium]|nr:DUF1573 domain-containing protein [bacterium]